MNIKLIALLLIVAIAFVSFVDSMPDPGKKYGGSSHAPYYKKYKKHYYHYHHHYHNHKHKHKHSHKHKHKYTQSSHGHSSHGYSGDDEDDEGELDEQVTDNSTSTAAEITTATPTEAQDRMDPGTIYFGLLSSLLSSSDHQDAWMDDGGYSPISSYAAEVEPSSQKNPLKELFRETMVNSNVRDADIRSSHRHSGAVSEATAAGFFDDDEDVEDHERDDPRSDQIRGGSRPTGSYGPNDGLGYLTYSVVYSGRRQADEPSTFDTDYMFFRDGDDPSGPATVLSTGPTAPSSHHPNKNAVDYDLGDYPSYDSGFVHDIEAEDDDEFDGKRGVRGAQGYSSLHEVSRITGDISGIGPFLDYSDAVDHGELPSDGMHHHIHSHTHKHALSKGK